MSFAGLAQGALLRYGPVGCVSKAISSAYRLAYLHQRHSWQRGTNENTNGLLRQYLPKGTGLSGCTQHELNAIAYCLNTRPRKFLNFATPLEGYSQLRHPSLVALGT